MPSVPHIGELALFGFNFPPVGWARCEGQLLPIVQYDALFTLIGTTYGGDGQTTFALPDLRGRVVLHQGTGPGLPAYSIGQAAGVPQTSLTVAQMPAHSHNLTGTAAVPASAGAGTSPNPAGNIPAGSATVENYAPAAAATGTLGPLQVAGTAQATGGGQPVPTQPPYLAVNICIALEGIFPQQN